jgi:hypothetical protein
MQDVRIGNFAANSSAKRLRRQIRARTGERHDNEQCHCDS